MILLKPYECHHCGVVDEAQFVFSGPHIKQVCNNCDAYVKFIPKSQVPDATETKLRIWALTNQDEQKIAQGKSKCGFIDNLRGIERNMMYWRLYLSLRREVDKEVEV